MQIGDIILIKDEHYLKEFIKGKCEIIGIKMMMLEYRYNIRTLDYINGEKRLTWLNKDELLSISEVRNSRIDNILK